MKGPAAASPSTDGPSSVELSGVSMWFGPVRALEGLDLVVPTGQLTTVVGPSGCGKTTTLRLVAGFEAPDAGEVRVSGRLVAGGGQWVPPERRGVGIVFQQLALFPHLNVGANVGYGLASLDRRARRARVGQLLDLVGLSGYESRYPDQLSGGQAQRVALARALAPRPAVVLLDEPFANLDVSLRAGLRREVRAILAAEGATTLLVTHDQDEALSCGDQVAVMLRGRIAQMGPPEHVYAKPATAEVAAFLGDANLLPGEVRAGVIDTELGQLQVQADVPGGHAVVLVRPEGLEVEVTPEGSSLVLHAEYHGHDHLVVVALPSGRRVRARVGAGRPIRPGDRVAVRPAPGPAVAYPRPRHSDAAVPALPRTSGR
jgi:iron(III) transport system ATP-binding protein